MLLYQVFVFLLGVCIGSFLNCVIYRLETGKTLAGRSFCPKCKHVLSWKDLFPVFSFLFLKGKCRYCKDKIAWQYPAVEISTAAIFLLIFSAQGGPASGWNFINLLFLFYVASALIVIFVYDLKHYLIPDKILLPAILISGIWDLFRISDFGFRILAALVASGFFAAIFLISKGRWMGFGDVKLAILMGLVLGLPNVLVALFLAFFIGAIAGLILMFKKQKKLKSQMPFAPFLITGTFAALLWGDNLIQWYLNLFQI